MITLARSHQAWGSEQFAETLKAELEALSAEQLPLQQGLAYSSHVSDRAHNAMVLSITEEVDTITAKVGILYAGIIAGCQCADDPSPIEENNEYCEVRVRLNKHDASAVIEYLPS